MDTHGREVAGPGEGGGRERSGGMTGAGEGGRGGSTTVKTVRDPEDDREDGAADGSPADTEEDPATIGGDNAEALC